MHSVGKPERAHLPGERIGFRQHVRQAGLVVNDRIDVEEHSAGNMREQEFNRANASGVRQMPRRVYYAEIDVAKLAGKFARRAEILGGHLRATISSGEALGHTACAATDLKRTMASQKKRPPIPATATNSGHTTSSPAPR